MVTERLPQSCYDDILCIHLGCKVQEPVARNTTIVLWARQAVGCETPAINGASNAAAACNTHRKFLHVVSLSAQIGNHSHISGFHQACGSEIFRDVCSRLLLLFGLSFVLHLFSLQADGQFKT